jgi:putative aminopeptidase FrvX
MPTAPHDFFKTLLMTPSPSGYEAPIQNVVRDYLGEFCDEVTTDSHGNVIACKNPGADVKIMLAGHCDQIGLIVTHIDETGFIYAGNIGGWDPMQLIGQRMTIHTASGPVPAVIARKAIHLLTDEERKQPVKLKDLWLDIGVSSRDEVAGLVAVGDCVTLELGWQQMQGDFMNSPAMDDKTGVYVVIEALRRVDAAKLNCSLYAVSTVQEEIGLRGARTSAYGIDPQVGIAVDVTHATDCPTIDKKQEGDIALGKGPVVYRGPNMNHTVVDRLLAAADAKEIPIQLAASGRAQPNDANSIQINRAGVAAGLVSIPNRYMHSAVEMISLADIDHAADLLAAFAEGVTAETDFVPR